jgi:hypothetical protein
VESAVDRKRIYGHEQRHRKLSRNISAGVMNTKGPRKEKRKVDSNVQENAIHKQANKASINLTRETGT